MYLDRIVLQMRQTLFLAPQLYLRAFDLSGQQTSPTLPYIGPSQEPGKHATNVHQGLYWSGRMIICVSIGWQGAPHERIVQGYIQG